MDGLKDENGDWDVPLMMDILNHSKKLRFYSRFGAFYKEKGLNFNNLNEPAADAVQGELDLEETQVEDIKGDAAVVVVNMINPFTMQPATRADYTICITQPEWLQFRKDKLGGIALNIDFSPHDFIPVRPNIEFKEIIKAVCRGEIRRIAA
jgi:hypothetical protein